MNEVRVNRLFGERNKYTGHGASTPLCLAIRPEFLFSLGSSLDLVITAEASQHLDSHCSLMAEPELLPPIWVGVDEARGIALNLETRRIDVSHKPKERPFYIILYFKQVNSNM